MPIAKADVERILAWVVDRGMIGDDEIVLLNGLCQHCVEAGLDVARGTVIIDTLHPLYEGRVFNWRRDGNVERPVVEYPASLEGEAAEAWRRSPFYHLLESGGTE